MDSTVRCSTCRREERVSFGRCLGEGWPKCCGYTMTLVSTDADIGAAVAGRFGSVRHAARLAREER